MRFVATTISRQQEQWQLSSIPWHCETRPMTEPVLDPYHYTKGLGEKRNYAVEQVLRKNPEATDVIMCDSYYVSQGRALSRLITDYELAGGNMILGGAIWGVIRARLKDWNHRGLRWFDEWSVPEFHYLPYRKEFTGLRNTTSVGGIHIFPRWLWDQGVRYGQSRLLGNNQWHHMQGCENNYFCNHAPIVKMVDFDAKFYRERIYPLSKRLRIAIGLRSRIRRLSGNPFNLPGIPS